MRGDVRYIRNSATSPTPSQMSCLCQMVDTNVGTSVWPAEYSAARPYAASPTVTARSGLSISWRGGRIAGVGERDARVRWRDRHDRGILDRRWAGEQLPGMRRGVRRKHDPDVRCRRGIDSQVVPDHARDERCHIWTLARELDDRAHHDLGLLGGREPDEPAVVRSVGVLRRAGLAGDGDVAAEAPGAARRAPLHHADLLLAQPGG